MSGGDVLVALPTNSEVEVSLKDEDRPVQVDECPSSFDTPDSLTDDAILRVPAPTIPLEEGPETLPEKTCDPLLKDQESVQQNKSCSEAVKLNRRRSAIVATELIRKPIFNEPFLGTLRRRKSKAATSTTVMNRNDGQNNGRLLRSQVQPVFEFSSINSGPKPPSILKQSSRVFVAKRVSKKYRKIGIKTPTNRKIRFRETCTLRLISPLPGYVDGVVRMSESDEEEDAVAVENPRPRLFRSIILTPESKLKVEKEKSKSSASPSSILCDTYNAVMIFGDENEQASDSSKVAKSLKKKKRRVSTMPLMRSPIVNQKTDVEEVEEVVKPDATNEDTCAVVPVAIPPVKKEEKLKEKKSRRRSTAISVAEDSLENKTTDSQESNQIESSASGTFSSEVEQNTGTGTGIIFISQEQNVKTARRKSARLLVSKSEQSLESGSSEKTYPPNQDVKPRKTDETAKEFPILRMNRDKSHVLTRWLQQPDAPDSSSDDVSRSESISCGSMTEISKSTSLSSLTSLSSFSSACATRSQESMFTKPKSASSRKRKSVAPTPSAKRSISVSSLDELDEIVVIEKCNTTTESSASTLSITEKFKKPNNKKKSRRKFLSELDYDRAPFSALGVTDPIHFECTGNCELYPSRSKLPSRNANPSWVPIQSSSCMPDTELEYSVATKSEVKALVNNLPEKQGNWYKYAISCREAATAEPWCDALRPRSHEQWLGDEMIASTARKFLVDWKRRVRRDEEAASKQSKKKKDTTDSDSDEDYDIDEVDKEVNNPLILCGPTASGKSSLIYALAEELGLSIQEINAGDKRNATVLKSKIAGATQNHKVFSGASISSFFSPSPAQKKTEKQQNVVVIEDVDIVYEDLDRDFWPTLKTIVAETRCPIIFTCSQWPPVEATKEPHVETIANPTVLHLSREPLKTVANYVKCCALALERVLLPDEAVERLVDRYDCDVRAVLMDLQMQLSRKGLPLRLPAPREFIDKRSLSFSQSSSVYMDRLVLLEDKKAQYGEVYAVLSDKKMIYNRLFEKFKYVDKEESLSMDSSKLDEARIALNNFASNRALANDYLPILTLISDHEAKRSRSVGRTSRRKPMSYLCEVKGYGTAIDTNGALTPLLPSFKLPSP